MYLVSKANNCCFCADHDRKHAMWTSDANEKNTRITQKNVQAM